MNSKPEYELEMYKARLRREEQNWQARYENARHSDRAAIDTGLVALRTAILINAGALVALLTFVGQLWGKQNAVMQTVLSAMQPFVWGLLAAAVSAGIAYFYQSSVTFKYQRDLAEVSTGAEELKPLKWLTPFSACTAILMVGLVIASYILFAWGAWSTISVLDP